MSRPIGAFFHVPHGISNAMLLKECLKFAADGVYERFGELGKVIGVAKAAENFIGTFYRTDKKSNKPRKRLIVLFLSSKTIRSKHGF